MAHRAPSHSITSLEEVQAQLTAWRSGSQRARRIPDELWDAAVSLCAEHSVCKVSRALGLDYKALRARTLKGEQTRPPRKTMSPRRPERVTGDGVQPTIPAAAG